MDSSKICILIAILVYMILVVGIGFPSLTLPKKERTENKLKKSRFYADFLSFFY